MFYTKNINIWPQNISIWPQNIDIWAQNIDIWPQNIDKWSQDIDKWPQNINIWAQKNIYVPKQIQLDKITTTRDPNVVFQVKVFQDTKDPLKPGVNVSFDSDKIQNWELCQFL